MKLPYSKEELESYFSGFERMGEPSVRATVESGLWENDRMRLGAAKVWLQQKDDAKQPPETKPWHERAWGKIIIGFIVALLAWFFGFYANQYLQKDRSQYQPKGHEDQKKSEK